MFTPESTDFVPTTSAICVIADTHLTPTEKFVLGSLAAEIYYETSCVIDVPRHVFNEELREQVLPYLATYNVPYLILRGASPHPKTFADGHPDNTRHRSRTLIVLLRTENGTPEDVLLTIASDFTEIDPQTTLEPYAGDSA